MVSSMKTGSVIVDVSIDQGGCFETSRPTTLSTPTFVEQEVIHYCVPNMTGAVARTATQVLNNTALPFVQAIANRGVDEALRIFSPLARGVYTHDGYVTRKSGLAAQGAPMLPLHEALSQGLLESLRP